MIIRTASCRCGAALAVCRGDPVRISICHCLACKQRTGSAFSYNATYDWSQIEVSGETRAWERRSEEGNRIVHHFCTTCGATAWYEPEIRPGRVTIPAGNFADPDFPAPFAEVYRERRQAWLPKLGIEGD